MQRPSVDLPQPLSPTMPSVSPRSTVNEMSCNALSFSGLLKNPPALLDAVKLPDGVDAMKLYDAALAAGVAINPGPQWSVNKEHARSRMRLCFASPSHEEINQGVAKLAEVCRREFGVLAPQS